MAATTRDEIANRAADQFVGQRGLPCARCKSRLAYVNLMGHIKCRTCDYPAKPEFVRLPLVLIEVDSINVWADGRIESKLEKLSAVTGVDLEPIRRFNNLPVELKFDNTLWPPRLE